MMTFDEFGLIEHLCQQSPRQGPHVRVGIGDDAAVLTLAVGEEQLVTTDTLVAGVHFLPQTLSMEDVGYKAVVSSVSDVAAMGGEPRHVLLALAIPENAALLDLEALYEGVAEACREYRCTLVGGDVVHTAGPLVITSTVLGGIPAGTALLRSGAQQGDVVFVTGRVGGSGAGLALLVDPGPFAVVPEDEWVLQSFHRRPKAQVEAGLILRQEGAHSCNDITDGLASELNELATASRVRLRVDAQRVPVASAVRNFARARGQDPLIYAWYGGEDYQLVGTAPPLGFARALARCASVGIELTAIGRVEAGDGVVVEWEDGRQDVLAAKGYNHFPQKSEAEDRG
ncbi:thiamine-phosphate kinase [Alicyclobacillaceae bacterium I2511]|nr:thiamine-phosphate kinase [Alicyclobacillaceae bacterium I2511]